MTPQELKNSILDMAMQGRLTEQILGEDAHIDYPSLCDIRSLPSFSNGDEEPPYDIPENWIWTRLKDIATNQNGYSFKPSDWKEKGLRIIRIQNLTDPNAPCNYCDDKEEYAKFIINRGDVLVSWSCTIDSFVYYGEKAVLNQHIFRVDFDKIKIFKLFYVYAIKSLLTIIDSKRHGSTMTHITKKDFESLIFPVPPYEEQKRIVAKIQELLPLIERYELAWEKLEDFNRCFPVDMQKAILQMAIQGDLVPQDASEGTGEDLYSDIQKKKNQLIKEKKLKKEKILPTISKDEIPFDVPEGWKWAYVNEIAFVTKLAGFEYTKYMSGAITSKGEVPIVRAKNIKPNRFMENQDEFISLELSKQLQRCALDTRCVLMTFIGAGIGEVAVFEGCRRNHLAPNVAKIVPHVDMSSYLMYYFMSPTGQKEIFKYMKAVAQPSLSMETIRKVKVPLPPISEQKRIVEKLEVLLPLCERLKA